jgi:hypothetical protein
VKERKKEKRKKEGKEERKKEKSIWNIKVYKIWSLFIVDYTLLEIQTMKIKIKWANADGNGYYIAIWRD